MYVDHTEMTIEDFKTFVDSPNTHSTLIEAILKELEGEIETADDAYEERMNSFDYGDGSTMFEFQEYMVDVQKVCAILSCKKRYIQPFKMEPLGDIGDLFTIEDFTANVECGGFINYDGFGHYATVDQESDLEIYPSDIKRGLVRHEFTHVMWYNR